MRLIVTVKGNGYGLGILPFSKCALECGAHLLAVSNLEEARALREGGVDAEILLMSPTCIRENAEEIIRLRLTAAIGSVEGAVLLDTAAREQNCRVRAHLKIDTGFGRFGFLPEETDKILTAARSLTNVQLCGIFSHLSASFAKNQKLTQPQLALFGETTGILEAGGLTFEFKHIANSCAALRYPESRYNAVRVSSAVIGRIPIKNTYGLKKVGFLECDIDELRFLPAGHNVGYANTYKTKRPTKVAVLSAGYSDGIAMARGRDTFRMVDRMRYLWVALRQSLSLHGLSCSVGGKKARILGRVGLTNCVADVTGISCSAGDIATFDINPLFVDSSVERVYR